MATAAVGRRQRDAVTATFLIADALNRGSLGLILAMLWFNAVIAFYMMARELRGEYDISLDITLIHLVLHAATL